MHAYIIFYRDGNETTPNGACRNGTIDWSWPIQWDWVKETEYTHTELYKDKYNIDVFISKVNYIRHQCLLYYTTGR